MNEHVDQVTMSSTTQNFDLISGMSSCGLNDLGTRSISARTFLPFPRLPAEIRLQIIHAAIGDRVIHIKERVSNFQSYRTEDERGGIKDTIIRESKLSNYRCICDLTDETLHDWFSEPVVFKNRLDWHMRPRVEEQKLVQPHGICINWNYADTTPNIDLSLFAVSREIKQDALRIFYSRGTFSFSSVLTLRKWFGDIASPATIWSQSLRPPPGLKDCIRKLRIDSEPYAFDFDTWLPVRNEFDPRCLARAFELLSTQLPNLT